MTATPDAASGPVDEGLTDGTFSRVIPFRDLGPDALADSPQPWPAWTVNQKRTLAPEEALRGWKFWRIEEDRYGPALVAPFVRTMAKKWEEVARMAPQTGSFSMWDITWRPGLNVARHFTLMCSEQDIIGRISRGEPCDPVTIELLSRRTRAMGWCKCGICVARSLTVLRTLDKYRRMDESSAYAEVDVWGQTVPRGQYQLRAEFAELAGPLHIASAHRAEASALAARYQVEVIVAPDPSPFAA